MASMGPRLKDIALRANVSQATVSLVLNRKPGVSIPTRERIIKIARDLEYGQTRKDTYGAFEATGTIRFLKIAMHGHTVNRDHDVFIADYIDGLAKGALGHELSLEVATFDRVPVEEIVAGIGGPSLRGVVALGTELGADDIAQFGGVDVPVLFLDTFHDFLDFDFVDMNNRDAVSRIVTYLFENGHRDIGFARSPVNTRNFHLRDESFHHATRALGLEVSERNIFTVDSTFQGAYKDMGEQLSGRDRMPTGLVCTNDIIAYGCIKALREHGFGIPDDVSVVGFDNLPLSSVMDPPLTTMQVSKQQMGELAIDLISNRIARRGSSPAVKVQVGGSLIVRDSVRRLALG